LGEDGPRLAAQRFENLGKRLRRNRPGVRTGHSEVRERAIGGGAKKPLPPRKRTRKTDAGLERWADEPGQWSLFNGGGGKLGVEQSSLQVKKPGRSVRRKRSSGTEDSWTRGKGETFKLASNQFQERVGVRLRKSGVYPYLTVEVTETGWQ